MRRIAYSAVVIVVLSAVAWMAWSWTREEAHMDASVSNQSTQLELGQKAFERRMDEKKRELDELDRQIKALSGRH